MNLEVGNFFVGKLSNSFLPSFKEVNKDNTLTFYIDLCLGSLLTLQFTFLLLVTMATTKLPTWFPRKNRLKILGI